MPTKTREEPRSVPESAPGLFDAIHGGRSLSRYPSSSVLGLLQPKPGAETLVTIGGQRYRQVDNGRANTLVPVGDPSTSPADLANRPAAADRIAFMAENPLAGAAYGVAALAGASPQTRDRAMLAGGAMDATMLGAAPLGARMRSPLRAPLAQPPLPTKLREPARYGAVTPSQQATGMNATVTRPMLNTGKDVNQKLAPPGWLGDGDEYNQARGHLFGKQLGGTGNNLQEVVTLTQNPTNNSQMKRFENAVKRRVSDGEVVEYYVKPLYESEGSAPSWIAMSAQGSRGDFTPKIIFNPSSRPR